MKLKKIASLMLAGTMAVSMLVGCSNGSNGGNNNSDGNTVVEPSTSSIVTAFNNGQNEDNEVKVTFSSDAALDAALKKAIENAGEDDFKTVAIGGIYGSPSDKIEEYVGKLMGKTYDTALLDKNSAKKDGQSATLFNMYYVSSTVYWTEEDAVNAAVRAMDECVAELKATTKEDGMKVGAKYYDFSYTGTISMVSAKQEGGRTVYYIAYTITQTAAEQTVKAE